MEEYMKRLTGFTLMIVVLFLAAAGCGKSGGDAVSAVQKLFADTVAQAEALTAEVKSASAEELEALQGKFDALRDSFSAGLNELREKFKDTGNTEEMQKVFQEGNEKLREAVQKGQDALHEAFMGDADVEVDTDTVE
jgi:hypothetical protein